MKSIKTKLCASASVAVMALSVVIPSFVGIAEASVNTTKTVYIDVEKNITGQNVILQPIAVTLSSTATILDATKQAIGDNNSDKVDANAAGTYIKAFKDSTDTFEYAFTDDLPAIVYDTETAYNQPIIPDSTWLREKEYNGISGWMFTVNNTDTYSGGFYTAGTTLANVPDDAVIRWEFSMACGCDLGRSGYLPDGTVTDGYYNWNSTPSNPFFTGADKTQLISAMADCTNKSGTAYTNALNVLKTLDSTQGAVDTVAAALQAE